MAATVVIQWDFDKYALCEDQSLYHENEKHKVPEWLIGSNSEWNCN